MPLSNQCAFKTCSNTSRKNPDLSFHRFPSDNETRKQWVMRAGRSEWVDLEAHKLENQRVCSQHFDKTDFINHDRRYGKRKLKSTALPCAIETTAANAFLEITIGVQDPDNQEIRRIEETRMIIPTEKPVVRAPPMKNTREKPPTTHREQRLAKKLAAVTAKLKVARQKIRRFTRRTVKPLTVPEIIEGAARFLTDEALTVLKMQLTHTRVAPWLQDEKRFALELFQKSPKTYIWLRNKNFVLPSASIIRKWLGQLKSTAETTEIGEIVNLPEAPEHEFEIEDEPETELELEPTELRA